MNRKKETLEFKKYTWIVKRGVLKNVLLIENMLKTSENSRKKM